MPAGDLTFDVAFGCQIPQTAMGPEGVVFLPPDFKFLLRIFQ
jgi:hypothetical protein